jgi:predicted PurR-regulated permease PerM
VLIIVPVLTIPALVPEINLLSEDLLNIVNEVQDAVYRPVVIGPYIVHLETILPEIDESLTSFLRGLPENSLHFLESFSRNTAWFLVIVVTIYYLMLDWNHLREWMMHLVPDSHRLDLRRVYLEIKNIWAAYFRGQLVLMLIVAIVFSIVWLAIGLPGAFILGVITGLFSIVPEIGPLAATVLAMAVAFIDGSSYLPLSNFWFGMLVLAIYMVLINFKNIWLRPRIMGRSVNLNEGLVFVAIIAAVMFSGILGALIIVPVIASAGVAGSYLRAKVFGLSAFPSRIKKKSIKLSDEENAAQQ